MKRIKGDTDWCLQHRFTNPTMWVVTVRAESGDFEVEACCPKNVSRTIRVMVANGELQPREKVTLDNDSARRLSSKQSTTGTDLGRLAELIELGEYEEALPIAHSLNTGGDLDSVESFLMDRIDEVNEFYENLGEGYPSDMEQRELERLLTEEEQAYAEDLVPRDKEMAQRVRDIEQSIAL